MSALNIKYRDFRYVIPFLVQALLFLTPVIYPVTIISNSWMQAVLALNPMFGAIEIFRAPLSGQAMDINLVGISVGSGFVFLLVGLLYFRKTEIYFADLA